MVEIIQIFNGSQGAELTKGQPARFRQFHIESQEDAKKENMKKQLPSGNLFIYKGSMAAIASRGLVTFVLHNKVAKDYFIWSQIVWAPEEQFSSNLVHNLHAGVPGGFPGSEFRIIIPIKSENHRYQVLCENCKRRTA